MAADHQGRLKVIEGTATSSAHLYKEQRVLPRFPVQQMLFKGIIGDQQGELAAFEVKNISAQGALLERKIGQGKLKPGTRILGHINWPGKKVDLGLQVEWSDTDLIGVTFLPSQGLEGFLEQALSLPFAMSTLKPLHQIYQGQLPGDMLYWFKSFMPFEMILWGNSAEQIKRCLVVFQDRFVQWDDQRLVQTGQRLYGDHSDVAHIQAFNSTELSNEQHAYELAFDSHPDQPLIEQVRYCFQCFSAEQLPAGVISSMNIRLRV